MVCEVPTSTQEQQHLLGVSRGLLLSPHQHPRLQLGASALASTQGTVSRDKGMI